MEGVQVVAKGEMVELSANKANRQVAVSLVWPSQKKRKKKENKTE